MRNVESSSTECSLIRQKNLSDDPCTWPQSSLPCSSQKEHEVGTLYKVSDGPTSRGHAVRTDYNIKVSGHTIPIVRTVRDFSVSYGMAYAKPAKIDMVAVEQLDGSMALAICSEVVDYNVKRTPKALFKDKCVIEKSTLHYLDQRYGVCLYRYVKDELDVTVSSDKLAEWRTTTVGGESGHMVIITDSNYIAESTVEWRLVIDGVMQVLSTTKSSIFPFGVGKPPSVCSSIYAKGLVMNQTARQILVFPQPPSQAIAMTPEIDCFGFYDYGNLPGEESGLARADGGKDMFYPEWCRNLQEDPFWRAAADSRYNQFWFHTEPTSSDSYEPPPIVVDPIPIGSFARHPEVGDVYQFLIDKAYTSPDLTALIDAQLPDNMKTHDTTLYSPISLV